MQAVIVLPYYEKSKVCCLKLKRKIEELLAAALTSSLEQNEKQQKHQKRMVAVLVTPVETGSKKRK